MKTFLLLPFLGCALLAGCGDGGKSSSSPSGNPVTAPADYLGSITKAQHSAVKTVDAAALIKAITTFQAEQGKYPADLEELVKLSYISKIPVPPVGSRLVYDATNGMVKVVSDPAEPAVK